MRRATVRWAAVALVGAACFASPALGADRIYWTNAAAISFSRLDGSGGADLATTGATLNGPYGVGLDPAAGRVYWVNASGTRSRSQTSTDRGRRRSQHDGRDRQQSDRANALKVSFAALDGSGGGDVNTTGATVSSAGMPALLESPAGVAPPATTGGVQAGSTLSCSNGSWAADLVHEHRYLAPASFAFQWSRDGAEIAGATSNSVVDGSPGAYGCRVTATNEAGSTSQTSAAHTFSPPSEAAP